MKKLLFLILHVVSADFRSRSYVELEHESVRRGTIIVHNVQFLLNLALAGLFFIDLALLDGLVGRGVAGLLHLNSVYLGFGGADPLKLLYLLWTAASVPVALWGAVYFRAKESFGISRADIVGPRALFPVFGSLVKVIGGLFFAAAFFMAGYLCSITFFERTGLERLPGAIIVQVLIAIKLQSYVAIAQFSAFIQIIPYRTTPLGRR